ncbi:MAG: molybdenum cofactor guanylyltransferase [Acidobacteriaceae bacterium]
MNAFVLAGGRSSRMGSDKALLEFNGQPLIAHALELLRAVTPAPRICGSRPDLATWADVIPDNCSNTGPLGGIEAALSASTTDLNLFLPVDLPNLPIEFLRILIARAEDSHAVATIPTLASRPQPLTAIYSRRLLPGIRAALTAGNYKVTTAINQAAASLNEATDQFAVESLPGAQNQELWFQNLNTPADYDSLRSNTQQK